MRTSPAPGTVRSPAESSALKVPHVAGMFWLVKVVTTGMGESISDFLAGHNRIVAVIIGFVGFAAALVVQIRSSSYHAVRYWTAVAMVAVFGTMAADAVHVVMGVPYEVTTIGYALAVAAVLTAWRSTEGCISIHTITTHRRESFYWLTVLATFALGTAAGDFSAFTMRLGYLDSVWLFGGAIALVVLAWRFAKLGSVVSFWTAYVFTRPLGASIADWLGKPAHKGNGLGLGDGVVSVIGLAIFCMLVGYLAITGADRPRADEPK